MKVSIVVPVYNEQDNVLPLAEELNRLTAALPDLEVLLVDDGSRDGTWGVIESLAAADSRVVGLKLSRNRGHQNALLAGLMNADGDAVISLDADLQDDVAVIDDMITAWQSGFEIVFGVRRSRKEDSFFKRWTARRYYALLAGLMNADGDAVISLDADLQDDITLIDDMVAAWQSGFEIVYGVRRSRAEDSFFKRWTARRYYGLLRMLGVDVVPDHAEYRLLGRAALEALAEFPETNLFLRGLVPQLGFRSTQVLYDRKARTAGETKYPLRRMVGLGLDGITSFSAVPLRLIAAGGAVLFVLSSIVAVWVAGVRLFTDHAVPGWASTTLPIYALGGVQLLCLGVVGEYVAKVYMEVKRRPRYLIERVAGDVGGVIRTDKSKLQQ